MEMLAVDKGILEDVEETSTTHAVDEANVGINRRVQAESLSARTRAYADPGALHRRVTRCTQQ